MPRQIDDDVYCALQADKAYSDKHGGARLIHLKRRIGTITGRRPTEDDIRASLSRLRRRRGVTIETVQQRECGVTVCFYRLLSGPEKLGGE